MLLSVILITWNGRKLLSNCLKSMSFLLQREDVEVIVVDNGSEDGTIHFLHDKYPDITAISLDNWNVRTANTFGFWTMTRNFPNLWLAA